MENIKYKAHIKNLGWTVPVELIDFKHKYVAVDLSDGQGDIAEYSFDEVELMRYIGIEDKNGEEMYTGMKVKYAQIKYTNCSREEIEEVRDPIVGKLYFAEGIWFGIEHEDDTGSMFWVGTVDGEDFEVLDEEVTE